MCCFYRRENNLTIEQYELDLENSKIGQTDGESGTLLPNFNANGKSYR